MNLVRCSSLSTKLALPAFSITVTLTSAVISNVPAHAGNICPPGTYQQGGGNAGWIGCAPIPGNDPAPSQPSRPSGYWKHSHGALVWGNYPDGRPNFAWTAEYNSREQAKIDAMNLCTTKLQNCRLANEFSNGFLVVVKDSKGTLYQGFHEKRRRAERNARRACQSAGGKDCKVEQIVNSSPRFYRY
ncbi:DUF4189 domain-containing protein [Leptolyngbya boryana CZ1]|uniref:DUF4189 domain-containing protein n=1 Tax=Leptolyngbya boryana CZ1 TaxID=3060204 RepID=A0AA96WT96_LEPBY|nr:DUF4189 domain-containing protein [Leptolyngbya boryana]WNZ45291.1 DUF4189 domain-containing protein [Leptolyngbya boryana CZ1]